MKIRLSIWLTLCRGLSFVRYNYDKILKL